MPARRFERLSDRRRRARARRERCSSPRTDRRCRSRRRCRCEPPRYRFRRRASARRETPPSADGVSAGSWPRADRRVEHHAFARVLARYLDRGLAQSDRVGRERDAFGVREGHQIPKARTLLADPVRVGNRKVSNQTSFESAAPRPAFGVSLTSMPSRSASKAVEKQREAIEATAPALASFPARAGPSE